MSRMKSFRSTAWEGWFFAYGLTSRALVLCLFRLIPIARVPLAEVAYLRQRSSRELRRLVRDLFRHPGRSWYWPHPLIMGRPGFDHAPYVLATRRGARIYIRVNHGFHYRLREAINRARLLLRT